MRPGSVVEPEAQTRASAEASRPSEEQDERQREPEAWLAARSFSWLQKSAVAVEALQRAEGQAEAEAAAGLTEVEVAAR